MATATSGDTSSLDVWTDPAKERLGTSATVITFVRTVTSAVLAGLAVQQESLPLLVSALVV